MPNIIGKFSSARSTLPPLDAHVSHLKHLTNRRVARETLCDRHGFTDAQSSDSSKLIASYVSQAISFHADSRVASPTIRPVLQYYTYLNLSVAAILAFRPVNHEQHRRHGVEDNTHALKQLELGSNVVVVKRGAVPLFHSILSDVPLYNRKFRFGQLAAGFHMFAHEMANQFNKRFQTYVVTDEVCKTGSDWRSVFTFFGHDANDAQIPVKPRRLETAMPLLSSDYTCDTTAADRTIYTSVASWPTQEAAARIHRENGIKFINFGGHIVLNTLSGSAEPVYAWRGIQRIDLLPTLSSILLLSFSLASIVRYRPVLLDVARASPIALLIDTFTAEADSVFIPALRNLLYREEVAVGPFDFV